MKKQLKGAALKPWQGLHAPDPVYASSEKMIPANFFLLHVLPQSVRKLHQLSNISNINTCTHFDMFLKT